MASQQRKGDGWYRQFIRGDKRHTFTVGKVVEAEAKAKAARTSDFRPEGTPTKR